MLLTLFPEHAQNMTLYQLLSRKIMSTPWPKSVYLESLCFLDLNANKNQSSVERTLCKPQKTKTNSFETPKHPYFSHQRVNLGKYVCLFKLVTGHHRISSRDQRLCISSASYHSPLGTQKTANGPYLK